MVDLARPMLAEVLGCLSNWDRSFAEVQVRAVQDRRVLVREFAGGDECCAGIDSTVPLQARDPAEAQETLVARGLLPEGWCGDPRRGWHDRRLRSIEPGRLQGYDAACPSPRTIPDLVAVASLGWPAIRRAEELAREACAALREYGCPQPERVVWRVGERSDDRNLFAWRGAGGALRVVEGAKDRRIGPVSLWPDGVCEPARELWLSGLALDAIDRDAVRIVVPPVGGER